MASYNRVVLVGNLTRDPELRSTPSGASVATVGLAVNERRKDQGGNWIEETSFFDVDVWNRSAEVLRDYTTKGSPILVEGRLKQDVWEQDGQKRSKVKIIADRIVLLGSRDSANGGFNQQQGGYQQPQGGYQQPQGGYRRQAQPQRPAPSSQGYGGGDSGYPQEGADDIPF
ncbi:MAG: single-stranded DNA-binding protein [Thermoguttaceae bacterium]